MKNRLTNGNVKVKAYLFSLPPVKSCLNSKTCKDSCYAVKSYKQYPSVKTLWDNNFDLVKHDLKTLKRDIINQCEKISKQANHKRVIRIHQSGDFYNQAYVNMWHDIAVLYPTITFYGYTKVEKILNLNDLRELNNVNIISSTINVNGIERANFGTENYINYLKDNHGFKICPATYGENKENVKCGMNNPKDNKFTMCDYCLSCDKVAFLQH